MDNRCIVVTGASRGIGAAIAAALAGAGYTVGCLSRTGTLPQAGMDAAALARCIGIACDVTDPSALPDAYALLSAQGLTLAGAVNNAGIHLEGRSADLALADWNRVMEMNSTSVFLGCQAAYPHLRAAGGGLIVNIGSFFDKLGVKHNTAYCASKAAVGAITRCLAVEWAAKGISVVDVAPGYIATDLNREALTQGPLAAYLQKRIPRGTPGTAGDVARLVGALFTLGCGFMTGDTLYLDGAQGIAH
ncbi:MAG: SDR family oxidoreductase [Pseudomonadota bacterium]